LSFKKPEGTGLWFQLSQSATSSFESVWFLPSAPLQGFLHGPASAVNALFRNLDLLILAIALPIFVVAGFPLVGWLTGTLVWLAWRGIGVWTDRKAAQIGSDNPGRLAGVAAGSLIGRGWMMGIALIVVGLATDRATGLSACLLCVLAFTAAFVIKLVSQPAHRPSTAS
jgi:hypothetical protein